MDPLLNIGRSWLCWRSSSGLPYHQHTQEKNVTPQQLCAADWPRDQPEEYWADDFEHHQSLTNSSERRRSPYNWGVYIPGQYCQTGWGSRQWHREPFKLGQKCIQNAQQCLEVPAVQHQDQTEIVTELCRFHPPVWLRMLESDRKRPHQIISLPHKELEKNFKRGTTCSVSSREHGNHSHEKAMEMYQACA